MEYEMDRDTIASVLWHNRHTSWFEFHASRGSGPFVPSNLFIFGAPLFPLFFVLAGITNTQKQTDAKQREARF
jgi:hypothetical protein